MKGVFAYCNTNSDAYCMIICDRLIIKSWTRLGLGSCTVAKLWGLVHMFIHSALFIRVTVLVMPLSFPSAEDTRGRCGTG